jgi:hypothetical protein
MHRQLKGALSQSIQNAYPELYRLEGAVRGFYFSGGLKASRNACRIAGIAASPSLA